MRKLFILERPETIGQNEIRTMLIRANSEEEARHIANYFSKDEGLIWESRSVKCEIITNRGPKGLIMSDFKAA